MMRIMIVVMVMMLVKRMMAMRKRTVVRMMRMMMVLGMIIMMMTMLLRTGLRIKILLVVVDIPGETSWFLYVSPMPPCRSFVCGMIRSGK